MLPGTPLYRLCGMQRMMKPARVLPAVGCVVFHAIKISPRPNHDTQRKSGMQHPEPYASRLPVINRRAHPHRTEPIPQSQALPLTHLAHRISYYAITVTVAFGNATPLASPTATWHKDSYPGIDPSRPELSAVGKTTVITGAVRNLREPILPRYFLRRRGGQYLPRLRISWPLCDLSRAVVQIERRQSLSLAPELRASSSSGG